MTALFDILLGMLVGSLMTWCIMDVRHSRRLLREEQRALERERKR